MAALDVRTRTLHAAWIALSAAALLCKTPVDGCREVDDCPRDEFCTRGGAAGGYHRSFQCSSQTCAF